MAVPELDREIALTRRAPRHWCGGPRDWIELDWTGLAQLAGYWPRDGVLPGVELQSEARGLQG